MGVGELEREFSLCSFLNVLPYKCITYEKINVIKVKTKIKKYDFFSRARFWA